MNLDFLLVLFQIVVLLFAFSVHESVHAYATMRMGDHTAYMLGRVTLNPSRHIDPWGSVVMPLMSLIFTGFAGPMIGWGKPIPVTMRNFRRIRRDDVISTLAGLLSHIGLALIALALLAVMKHAPGLGAGAVFAARAMVMHAADLDLSRLPQLFPVALLLYYMVVINLLLFVFELIPVTPLDGSRLIRHVLPYNMERRFDQIGMFGSFVIFAVAWRIVYPLFYPPLIGAFDRLLIHL